MTTHQVNAAYWISDLVYLRTRNERLSGMVTGVNIRPSGVLYAVTWGNGSETYHWEFELSDSYIPEWEAIDKKTEASDA